MDRNYQKISSNLLKDLPSRIKEVILRRFGLESGQKETLEAIGKDFDITRERIRQIETDGISKIKLKLKDHEPTQETFQYFREYLKSFGNLRKENSLLSELGGEKGRAQVYFLLTLGENFKRFPETDDFYPFWTIDKNSLSIAKEVINSFYNKLKEINRPLSLALYQPHSNISKKVLISYVEISKKIQRNEEGLFGLKDWPEINPRGVKDKAYSVFRKTEKPLHFTEVAKLIDGALLQTVHNELIKDQRFVLIGRGIYALREWGYEGGEVKDVISKILKESEKPLTKEEILEKVFKQRLVKENTILLNLSNKKYFLRTEDGRFTLKTRCA